MTDYSIPKEKIKQMLPLMRAKDIDAVCIIAREGSDDFLPFICGETAIHVCAALFCQDGKNYVIASPSDSGMYRVSGIFDEVITYGSSMWPDFVQLIDRLNPRKLALSISEKDSNADGLTLGLYLQLQAAVGRERLQAIEVSSEAIQIELHSVKTPTEIATLRQGIQLTNDIYDEVFAKIRIGMSEIEIGDLFVAGMKARSVFNGLGEPYDYPIVCIVRAGLGHRSPGEARLEHGDIVIMDFSVNYQGYISDIARTGYCLAQGETEAPADIQHAFNTAHQAISETINFIGVGKRGYEVDAVGRQVVEAGGFPTVRHSVGHPIGTVCHDSGTRLGPLKEDRDNTDVMRPIGLNEVYAIEPTVIQDDGLPCMLVEEDVVIREDGAEILSRRQNELYLIAAN